MAIAGKCRMVNLDLRNKHLIGEKILEKLNAMPKNSWCWPDWATHPQRFINLLWNNGVFLLNSFIAFTISKKNGRPCKTYCAHPVFGLWIKERTLLPMTKSFVWPHISERCGGFPHPNTQKRESGGKGITFSKTMTKPIFVRYARARILE